MKEQWNIQIAVCNLRCILSSLLKISFLSSFNALLLELGRLFLTTSMLAHTLATVYGYLCSYVANCEKARNFLLLFIITAARLTWFFCHSAMQNYSTINRVVQSTVYLAIVRLGLLILLIFSSLLLHFSQAPPSSPRKLISLSLCSRLWLLQIHFIR